MSLLVAFAGIALGLSALGGYSVVNYTVSKRTHEMGVRIALGTSQGRIVRMEIRNAMVFVGIGIGLGLMLVATSARLLQVSLVGVSMVDPQTLTATVIIVILSALMAAFIPSRKAARVDPITALRCD
jgi:ABC-type antimicrobial peptide transport system permease subunit